LNQRPELALSLPVSNRVTYSAPKISPRFSRFASIYLVQADSVGDNAVAAGPEELVFMMVDSDLGADPRSHPQDLADLLQKARAGDASAFREVIVQHQRQVLITALRLLGSLELAQDAAQEVFLRLHKYLHRYDSAKKFSPWLYQVTVNVCRDLNRRRERQSMLSLEELRQNGELKELVDSVDLDSAMSRAEERRIVAEALKTLPEKEREALVLRDIQGLPTKQVARILGSSEATVRSQVSSARVKIKRFAERFLRGKP
jgi:RNA polymerase sigma-70 factor, ECF subfamily